MKTPASNRSPQPIEIAKPGENWDISTVPTFVRCGGLVLPGLQVALLVVVSIGAIGQTAGGEAELHLHFRVEGHERGHRARIHIGESRYGVVFVPRLRVQGRRDLVHKVEKVIARRAIGEVVSRWVTLQQALAVEMEQVPGGAVGGQRLVAIGSDD